MLQIACTSYDVLLDIMTEHPSFLSHNTIRIRAFVIHSKEMCDERNAFTMCPLCDKFCDYWNLSSACATARASHLFDNPATVVFSIFMALWGEYLFVC